MSTSQRISAAVGYIPVFGWIYAFLVERNDKYVMFHLKQAISLVLTLAGLFALWFVVAWILFAIPYADIFAMALFTIPLAALILGVILWVLAMINALRGEVKEIPIFGSFGKRIPI